MVENSHKIPHLRKSKDIPETVLKFADNRVRMLSERGIQMDNY